jgi:acetate kinase
MKILVINCGSSSLKYKLFDMASGKELCSGLVDRIGLAGSEIIHKKGSEKHNFSIVIKNHDQAVKAMVEKIMDKKVGAIKSLKEIDAIGHRVVHGGEMFSEPAVIDDRIMAEVKKCAKLAPLHNPANIKGIDACTHFFGKKMLQVAVFDTAFHQSMPEKAYLYGIPYGFYKKYNIRRYGFHGTSHQYVMMRLGEIIGKKSLKGLKVITCHLGNGASITAIKDGKSVDTSMGFTPLEGLVMGTRCGDIDPSIVTFLMKNEKMDAAALDKLLNKESGVLGISGISSDMRDIEKAAFGKNNKRAQTALDIYHYRIIKYIGAYAAAMNGVDYIVFTGGVGENGWETREEIMNGLKYLGVMPDAVENRVRGKEKFITTKGSRVHVYVIPTNEEIMIARETEKLVR